MLPRVQRHAQPRHLHALRVYMEVGKYTFEVEGDEPGSAPFTEAFAMWRPPM